MSTLALSPQDNRLFSAEIAAALEDINAAVIIQQLHYWMNKEKVGTIIKGVKFVYNSFNDWIKQFPWLSVWQFRKAMTKLRSLKIVKVIRYKSCQWNQTNYYSLNSDRLLDYLNLKKAGSIDIFEMCITADRDERNQQIEVRDSKLSYIEQRKTFQKETAKNREDNLKRSRRGEPLARSQSVVSSSPIAAASSFKDALEGKENQKEVKTSQVELDGLGGQKKAKLETDRQVVPKENNLGDCSIKVTKNLNPKWKFLIEELDSIGVPINKTLVNLVKMYEEEEVKRAISLIKIRKREKHIPNMAGYFTAALKGNWVGSNLGNEENAGSEEIDKDSVFRLWYDLAKELGYCTSQEIREGEQWVCLSGSWERWEDAVNRGYSLDYLKKIIKRNQGDS